MDFGSKYAWAHMSASSGSDDDSSSSSSDTSTSLPTSSSTTTPATTATTATSAPRKAGRRAGKGKAGKGSKKKKPAASTAAASSSEEEVAEADLRYSDCEDAYQARDSGSDDDGDLFRTNSDQQQQQQQQAPADEGRGRRQNSLLGFFRSRSRSRERSSSPPPEVGAAPPEPRRVAFMPPPGAGPVPGGRGKGKVRRVRKADTNVLSVNLGTLAADADLATGDCTECRRCGGVLSALSVLTPYDADKAVVRGGGGGGGAKTKKDDDGDDDKKEEDVAPTGGKDEAEDDDDDDDDSAGSDSDDDDSGPDPDSTTHGWACEFCGAHNWLCLEDEEIPKTPADGDAAGGSQMDYILDAAGVRLDAADAAAAAAAAKIEASATEGGADASSTSAGGVAPPGEEMVIFCVDVSGSMCVTTEVSGTQVLKGHERLAADRAALSAFVDPGDQDQYARGQRRDTTWVSRLQCAQAAIDSQLQAMAKEHPNRRVGLVAFNNDVTVVGDGSAKETPVVSGDLLSNFDGLEARGRELGREAVTDPIKDTLKTLSDKVFALQETGATALGPALLMSVAMIAGSGRAAGSRVVICTDGRANVGLGDLEGEGEDAAEVAEEFYSAVGDLAAQLGIVVSVVSIKGTDCSMTNLGEVADATGGAVSIVDPTRLADEFATILQNDVVATDVTVSVNLANGLFVRNTGGGTPVVPSDKDKDGSGDDDDKKKKRPAEETRVGNVTKDTVITFEYGVLPGAHLSQRAKKQMSALNRLRRYAGQQEEKKAEAEAEAAADGSSSGSSSFLPFQIRIEYTAVRDRTRRMRVLTRQQELTRDRRTAESAANVGVLGHAVAQQSAHLAMAGDYSSARTNAWAHKNLLRRCAETQGEEAQQAYGAVKTHLVDLDLELRSATRAERRDRGGRSLSDSDDESDDDEAGGAGARSSSSSSSSSSAYSKKPSKAKARKGQRNDALAARVFQMKSAAPSMMLQKKQG